MSEKNIDSLKTNLIILGLSFFVVCIIVAVYIFSISPEDKLIANETEALKTTAAIFGGLAVIINAYFAAKRSDAMNKSAEAANESAKAANKSAEAALENAKAAQDKQITERFSKAIELLGNQQIEVKLGGIYALEQIAKDAPEKYHWTIMEVLTAFVRENAALIVQDGVRQESLKLRTAIQAILTVIGRRNCENEKENQKLDLHNINIKGANLIKANLQGAYFSKANLQGAYFSKANLRGALLIEANLQGANLWKADLQGAYLIETNLRGALLIEANLQDANLSSANLQGADLRIAKNLTSKQIEEAIGDEDTKLPDYIDRPKHWTKSE